MPTTEKPAADTDTDTPLAELAPQRAAVADELDAAGDQVAQVQAQQLAAVPAEIASAVLRPLVALIEDAGGKLEGATGLGDPAVARALGAISDASGDAAKEAIIPEELAFEVDELSDAAGARIVAGKLEALAKDRKFARWFRSPAVPKGEAPKPVKAKPAEKPDGSEAEALDFMASRL